MSTATLFITGTLAPTIARATIEAQGLCAALHFPRLVEDRGTYTRNRARIVRIDPDGNGGSIVSRDATPGDLLSPTAQGATESGLARVHPLTVGATIQPPTDANDSSDYGRVQSLYPIDPDTLALILCASGWIGENGKGESGGYCLSSTALESQESARSTLGEIRAYASAKRASAKRALKIKDTQSVRIFSAQVAVFLADMPVAHAQYATDFRAVWLREVGALPTLEDARALLAQWAALLAPTATDATGKDDAKDAKDADAKDDADDADDDADDADDDADDADDAKE